MSVPQRELFVMFVEHSELLILYFVCFVGEFPYFMKTELVFMPFLHSFAITHVYMQWDSVNTVTAILSSLRMP